jgi:trimeric autotransporter adhesin
MRSIRLRLCLPLVCLSILISSVAAQQAALPAPAGIDESQLTTLHATVHAMARAEYDQGAVADDFPLNRLLLILARPADREQSLQAFLRNVHASSSAEYHQWVTPEEFGARFGTADADTETVATWLRSHGLSVARVTKGKSTIEFSGTAGQIRGALHTQIHRYSVQGVMFYANASEISVPQAIASRIAGFAPINSFPIDSYVKVLGGGTMNRANHHVTPQFTTSANNSPFYAFGPKDFATQYDVAPVYAAGINGTGQTIGIIGTSNLNLALVAAYRTLFDLPANQVQAIVDGPDPGDLAGADVEGYLDVEVSGAIAPNATVNFYIAQNELATSVSSTSLALAATRAVEDNQASVLSVSFGECELELSEAGNQLWAGLWEQAAAQGQTVFVSSGDSGPTTCQPIVGTFPAIQYLDSVNVNGIGSTPWNISVGGTDFYYSDYARGAPSMATLWNQTNDSSNGSLKASLSEQPWDNVLGLNAIPFQGGTGIPSAAGGGGPSNCSQETVPAAGVVPTCIAGYPKPAWQNAPGVPNDQVRDLPDVSLFAANGQNLSAAPICAEPGDCAAVTSGEPQVTLVGGTSVASPSMAGVMALINQKYGRQGQANYTLYGLARQYPSVFHDITAGTNDSFCGVGTIGPPDCDVPIANGPYGYSYGKYAAGPGYDLASGLGSIDVNLLMNDWNKVTYAASTTSLQVSPGSIVHGAAATLSVEVKANSGSSTPTGNVAIVAGSGTTIPNNVSLTLTGGAATASLTNLPGGSYQLAADYSGDGNFASSSSAPVSVTVTPEPSTTGLTYAYTLPSATYQPVQGQIPFGSEVFFIATPASLATKATGLATGTVTLTDTNGPTSSTVALASNGTATWGPVSLASGAHSVTATYSGDASYNGSTSSPINLTVVRSSPEFLVQPDVQPVGCAIGVTSCSNSGGEVYQPGSDMVLSILLYGEGNVPPTGTVTVNFGSLAQTVSLAPVAGISSAWVTFPHVPAGTYSLSASYPGDANWTAATYLASPPIVFGNVGFTATATTTTLALSSSSVNSSGSVTFNVATQTVSNQSGCVLGGGEAILYANGISFAGVPLSLSCNNGVTAASGSSAIPASELPPGTYQVVAGYQGLGPLLSSFSNAVPLTVTVTDFSLSVLGKSLLVSSGKSVSVPVALGGPDTSSLAVALSCQTSSPAITCSVSPSSASFTGSSTASMTVSAFTNVASGNEGQTSERFGHRLGEGFAAACLFFLALPRRRRPARLWMLLALCGGLSATIGCNPHSTNTTSAASNPIPPASATAGSYSVTVTGAYSGIIHNAKVSVQVQ